MSKQKIMFVSAANSIHTIRWVNALSEFFEIHLVYCKGHSPKIDKPNDSIKLHELKYKAPFGYYTNAWELKNLYNKIQPNLVNVHYASGYGTLVRISKIGPTLLSIWGSDIYDFPTESRIKKRILQKNVYYANAIASTSHIMAKRLKEIVPNITNEIFITPFGVDIEKFKKQNKKEKETFNIGNIKTLEKKYGIEYGILAIKKLIDNLKKQGKNQEANCIRMYIYGDGSQKEELQKLIMNNDLSNIVFLKGKIPNDQVPIALDELDIFCATSVLDSESFGVSVVEAMSCNLPVVASDVDGFCEVMLDGKPGYIVERKNVVQIAEALEKLMLNPEIRENMGQAGRKRVEENYNWTENVKYMKSIYEKLAKKINNG